MEKLEIGTKVQFIEDGKLIDGVVSKLSGTERVFYYIDSEGRKYTEIAFRQELLAGKDIQGGSGQ